MNAPLKIYLRPIGVPRAHSPGGGAQEEGRKYEGRHEKLEKDELTKSKYEERTDTPLNISLRSIWVPHVNFGGVAKQEGKKSESR